MATKIFDKDTILDLTVNVIPLGIIGFFILFFGIGDLYLEPYPFDLLPTVISYGLLVVPFVSLALLTYFSGKAIAGDEKRSQTYLAGQATVPGAKTLEEREEEAERHGTVTQTRELAADESGDTGEDEPENEESVTTHDAVTDDTDDASTGDDESRVDERPTTDDELVPETEDDDEDDSH